MIKVKIKDFKLNTPEKIGMQATLPSSLSSVLASSDGNSEILIDSSAARIFEFTGVIEIEPHILSMQHICLRFAGISHPAEVILNGKTISAPDSRERIYIYNVKDRLFPGYNTLTVRFEESKKDGLSAGIRYRNDKIYDPAIESVELLAFDTAAINSVNVTETFEAGTFTVNVNVGIIGEREGVRAVATMVSPSGKMYYGGIIDGRGSIVVSDPLLWWPSGMGVSNLYDLSVNLYCGDSAEDVYEIKVGLRTLELDRTADDLSIKVNGVPAFLKGARLMPEAFNSTPASIERAEVLISSAASAGINLLYVSADGPAPSSKLIGLCDKHGIILISEIAYREREEDNGGEIPDSIKREIIDGPRRMSYHASVAAFYIDGDKTPRAKELCELVSPICFGVPAVVGGGFSELSRRTDSLVSVPSLKTLTAFLGEADANVLSECAEAHTAGDGSLVRSLSALLDEYRFPIGTDELSYLSQLLLADRLQHKLTDARLKRRSSCLADRLNDTAPSISSSTVDYFGRWKAEHYKMRRLYAPVSVLASANGYTVRFILANDRPKEYSGTLAYRIFDFKNNELFGGSVEIDKFPVNRGEEIAAFDFSEYIKGHERDRYLAYSYADGGFVYSDTLLFTKHKYFRYKNPSLRANITGSGKRFDITLYAEAFAEKVRLEFASVDARFEDNYFDFVGNAPMRISVETSEVTSAERLMAELSIKSMYDVGRRL